MSSELGVLSFQVEWIGLPLLRLSITGDSQTDRLVEVKWSTRSKIHYFSTRKERLKSLNQVTFLRTTDPQRFNFLSPYPPTRGNLGHLGLIRPYKSVLSVLGLSGKSGGEVNTSNTQLLTYWICLPTYTVAPHSSKPTRNRLWQSRKWKETI